MRTRSRLLLAGLAAALMLLSVAAASTHARDLSITNRQIRITWGRVTLTSAEVNISCPLTLEGSFHSSTVHKTIGGLVGYVTRGTIVGSACTGGTVTLNQEALPWHVRYSGFSGFLPRISLVFLSLIGAKVSVTSAGQICITQSTAANPDKARAIINPTTGSVMELRADETAGIPLRGSFFCPFLGSGSFAGTGSVTQLATTNVISIRLI
jgi:hypothetical protein